MARTIAQVPADRVRQLAQHPERLRDGLSRAGKRVTVTLMANMYRGAQPYYVVTYQGRTPRTRYPVSREQAELLFLAYTQDLTDPQAVKDWIRTASGVLDAR